MNDKKTADESIIKRLNQRLSKMKSDRSEYETTWRDIRDHIMPQAGLFYIGDERRGSRKDLSIVDNTPTRAINTLRSGMMSGLTSPARPWFRLTVPNPALREVQAVRTWLSDVEAELREILSKSNFYNALSLTYGELGGFGTSVLLALEDDEKVVRFMPITTGRFWIATNYKGDVDTLIRECSMTVRQVVQEFGYEQCSERVRNMHDNGALEQSLTVYHAIMPNTDIQCDRMDARGMPWQSIYWEEKEQDKPLAVRGYREKPFMAPRWDVLAENVYGSSPAMTAIGDCKALQIQQKRKAQAIDKMVDPPLQAPTHLRNQPVYGIPGGVTYVDSANNGVGVRPLYEVNPNVTMLIDDIGETQQRINAAFYADLFLMLAMSDRRNITAREVEERHEEKLLMLGPVLERLNQELLDLVVDRVFALAMRAGRLPEPPEELQGEELKVEYISILAQAQKMVGIGALERVAGFVTQMAGVNADILDKFDFDQSVDEYAEMLGVTPRVIRSDDDVAAIRQQKAQQQQMQQMAAAAQPLQQATQAVGNLANAPVGNDSVLSSILESSGIAVA